MNHFGRNPFPSHNTEARVADLEHAVTVLHIGLKQQTEYLARALALAIEAEALLGTCEPANLGCAEDIVDWRQRAAKLLEEAIVP